MDGPRGKAFDCTVYKHMPQDMGRTSASDIRILCGSTNESLILFGVGCPSVSAMVVPFRKSVGKAGSKLAIVPTLDTNSAEDATSPSKALADEEIWRTRQPEAASRLRQLRVSMVLR
jgi:hypothetical protein